MARDTKHLVAGLKKILKIKKIPNYELARIIGCPDSTLSRWINDSFQPSLAWQKLIESNTRVQELLNETEKK